MLSLELGPEVANMKCDCCGKGLRSVNGYIKKDEWAYSIYFATLQSHPTTEAGLTISIGKWWEDDALSIKERQWIYMRAWPSESGTGFEIRVEEPENSRHADLNALGHSITQEEARLISNLDDFFDVAYFLIDNDPAVLSYLQGDEVSTEGRTYKHA